MPRDMVDPIKRTAFFFNVKAAVISLRKCEMRTFYHQNYMIILGQLLDFTLELLLVILYLLDTRMTCPPEKRHRCALLTNTAMSPLK